MTAISDDIQQAAKRYLRTWSKLCASTEPANRPYVEQLLCQSYRAAGLHFPRQFVWCPSPLATTWARSISTEVWQEQVGQNVLHQLVHEPIIWACRRVRHKLDCTLYRSLFADLLGGLRRATKMQEQALWDALTENASPFNNTPEHIKEAVMKALEQAGIVSIDLEPASRIYYGVSGNVLGPLTDGAIGLSFARRRLGLVAETEGIAPLLDLLTETHFFIPHENVCWLSERPTLINENGSTYGDGWSVSTVPAPELSSATPASFRQ